MDKQKIKLRLNTTEGETRIPLIKKKLICKIYLHSYLNLNYQKHIL